MNQRVHLSVVDLAAPPTTLVHPHLCCQEVVAVVSNSDHVASAGLRIHADALHHRVCAHAGGREDGLGALGAAWAGRGVRGDVLAGEGWWVALIACMFLLATHPCVRLKRATTSRRPATSFMLRKAAPRRRWAFICLSCPPSMTSCMGTMVWVVVGGATVHGNAHALPQPAPAPPPAHMDLVNCRLRPKEPQQLVCLARMELVQEPPGAGVSRDAVAKIDDDRRGALRLALPLLLSPLLLPLFLLVPLLLHGILPLLY